MLGSVFAKTVRDALRGLVWWTLGIVVLVAVTLSIFPTVEGNADFARLYEQYPEELKAFIGGQLDLTSAPGYLHAELFSFMVPLLLLVHAIGAGARAIAGEEEAGTLDLLLALPLRRTRVVLDKLAAMVALTGALAAVLFLSIWGMAVAVGMEIGGDRIAAACVAAWLLAVLYGALALLVGSAAGKKGAAIGVPTAAAVAAYLLDGLGNLVDALEPWRVLSPFNWYFEADSLRAGFAPGWLGLLLAAAAVFGALAPPAFARRDVGVG